MMKWLTGLLGEGEREEGEVEEVWVWDRIDEYPFEHHSDATGRIKHLVQSDDYAAAEDLLLWCVEFAEAEAEYLTARGRDLDLPAPWYYEQLANVYRMQERHDHEIDILNRYIAVCEELDQEPREELIDRLEEARDIAASR